MILIFGGKFIKRLRDYGFETSVLRHNWASAVAARCGCAVLIVESKRKQEKLHEIKFQTLWNFKFLETRENISSLSKCRIGIGRRRICGTLRHKIKEWILTQVIPFILAINPKYHKRLFLELLTCSVHAILHLIVLNTPRNSKQFLVKFEVHIVNVNLYFGLIDE